MATRILSNAKFIIIERIEKDINSVSIIEQKRKEKEYK